MKDYSNHNPEDLELLERARAARPLCRTRDDEGRRLLVPRCDPECPSFGRGSGWPGQPVGRCALTGDEIDDGDPCLPGCALAFDMVASS